METDFARRDGYTFHEIVTCNPAGRPLNEEMPGSSHRLWKSPEEPLTCS
jgi:hypothetical protein